MRIIGPRVWNAHQITSGTNDDFLILNPMHRFSKQLGEQLADLHCHNKRQLERLNKEQQTVGTITNTCRYNQCEIAEVETLGALILFEL